ncbi:fumarylacetoacetate hydrolase family protein [Microbacterium sp.]|uniref:fumarylacetoacetate hydrolase family protein n=1 Tax=Microbacterium sp. TaxID=51671 RepID=UPI003C726B7E
MRIARFQGADGADFAVSSDGGTWTALAPTGVVVHSTAELIARMDEVRAAMTESTPQPIAEHRLLSPVHRPGKILAIGLNYVAHAAETRAELPERPLIFAKYSSSLNGPFDDVVIGGTVTAEADYESELAVVIGRDAKRVSAADAMEHVFGYAVANDVSARDHQRRDGQFSRSKSADGFCPIGPWITTADEVDDVRSLAVTSTVNGEQRQRGVVSDLVFDIPTLIAYLSATITLEAGDVILTGTPPGVGLGMTPPVFLADGDVVECTVERLGTIRNRFVDGG